MSALELAVLHEPLAADARPDDLDTLATAAALEQALTALGHRPVRVELPRCLAALATRITQLGCAAVFNLVEAVNGEARLAHLAPLLLEAAGVPFTGAGSLAISTTGNKVLAKSVLRGNGVRTADWHRCRGPAPGGEAPGAWIVKSVSEHASLGIEADSVVPDLPAAWEVAAERRRRLGGEWFAERFVAGREFNVGLIGSRAAPRVLPIAEIVFLDHRPEEPRIVGYAAKWDPESPAYRRTVPQYGCAAADAPLHRRLEAIARQCWELFELRGYARVDFRVDDEGEPFVLEVNPNPCLAPDAGLALAAARAGIDYPRLVAEVLASAGLADDRG